MKFIVNKMRPKDPGERFGTAYILRPLVWLAFQFSAEAAAIRAFREASRSNHA